MKIGEQSIIGDDVITLTCDGMDEARLVVDDGSIEVSVLYQEDSGYRTLGDFTPGDVNQGRHQLLIAPAKTIRITPDMGSDGYISLLSLEG